MSEVKSASELTREWRAAVTDALSKMLELGFYPADSYDRSVKIRNLDARLRAVEDEPAKPPETVDVSTHQETDPRLLQEIL